MCSSDLDEFGRMLDENYGHACVPFMQYSIRKIDEIRDLYLETQIRIDKAAGLSQPHRFWSTQATSSLTGLVTAKRLNLVSYDIPRIFDWVVGHLIRARESLILMTTDPEELLTLYLAENYNNILRIRSTDDARNLDTTDTYIIPDSVPRSQLVARYEYDIKKMYLLPKPFREWCGKQQIDYADVVQGLKNGATKAYSKKLRLGKGTRMNLPPADCLILDCTTFMTDEKEDTLAIPQVNSEQEE